MADERQSEYIPLETLAENIKGVLDAIDTARVTGLRDLAALHEAKVRALLREKAQLEEELGASHPRVQESDSRITTRRSFTAGVAREVARASTPLPHIIPDAWTVHGRVWTTDLKPAKDVGIALSDDRDKRIADAGTIQTDQGGYFKLVWKVAPPTETRGAQGAEAPRGTAVRIEVSDRNGQRLHTDARLLVAQPGTVVYHEIFLPSGPAPGERPEPAHRPRAETRQRSARSKKGTGS